MKKPKKKSKLLFAAALLAIGSMLRFLIPTAQAGIVSDIRDGIIDATWPGAEEIIENLGLDLDMLRGQSQTSNVVELKQNGTIPTASITFATKNPKEGEKITAVGIASGFTDDKSKLYYTWFLKRKDCKLEVDGRKTDSNSYEHGESYPSHDDLSTTPDDGAVRSEAECDADKDGIITINDWKVAAMREIVRNGFTPDISGKYPDEDGFYSIHSSWNEEEDDDGYQSWQGGANAERMPAHCYAYNQTNGQKYELINTSSGSGGGGLKPCPNGERPVCGRSTTYQILDPLDNPLSEYPYCHCDSEEDCSDQGLSEVDTQDACQKSDSDPSCENIGGDLWTVTCPDGETPLCPESTVDIFLDDDYEEEIGISGYFFNPSGADGSRTENLPVCSCEEIEELHSSLDLSDAENAQSVCTEGGSVDGALLCGNADTGSGTDQFHVFPWSVSLGSGGDNYYENSRTYSGDSYAYNLDRDTGDDEFGMDEERFWKTDPRNPSTAGNGQADEANVAGLGINEFTWVYEEGDEVGLAVEGTSALPTKFDDSSRMIFWAFSAGDEKMKWCQPEDRGQYTPESSTTAGQEVNIPTGFLDFDRCMENATVSPVAGGSSSGGQGSGLEVELSVSPANLMNDEDEEEESRNEGGMISALAIATGSSEGESKLEYGWKIYRMDPEFTIQQGITIKPAEQRWSNQGEFEQICGENAAEDCPFTDAQGDSIKLKGVGLSELEFYSNISTDDPLYTAIFNDNGDGFLRFSVEVKESASKVGAATAMTGWGSEVVKITTSGNNQLTVFKLNTATGGAATNIETVDEANDLFKINIPGEITDSSDQVICREGAECQVSPNEIIGIIAPDNSEEDGTGEELTNFRWTVDGQSSGCDQAIADQCVCDSSVPDDAWWCSNPGSGEGMESRMTIIPVTQAVGETFTVTVLASNQAGDADANDNLLSGRSLELSRTFRVMDPEARIYPADVDCADGSGGSTAQFKEVGSYTDPTGLDDDQSDYSQSVLVASPGADVSLKACYYPDYIANGVSLESWSIDGASAGLPDFTSGDTGAVHTASLYAEYNQSTEIFSILAEHYDVPLQDMEAQKISASVQVEVESQTAGYFRKQNRFLAGLLSRVPFQFVFLFRIMMAVAVVVVLTGMIFAFFPKVRYD